MSKRVPLLEELEGYFEKRLDELPDALRRRVATTLHPLIWNDCEPDHRRRLAEQLGSPSGTEITKDVKKSLDEIFERKEALDQEIKEVKDAPVLSQGDHYLRKTRLAELEPELEKIESQWRQVRGDHPEKNAEKKHGRSKPRGHLNHDPEMQAIANQIAAEQKALTRRPITRIMVAKILAEKLGRNVDTVTRRIRKQW